jgi:hypothetical protein
VFDSRQVRDEICEIVTEHSTCLTLALQHAAEEAGVTSVAKGPPRADPDSKFPPRPLSLFHRQSNLTTPEQ